MSTEIMLKRTKKQTVSDTLVEYDKKTLSVDPLNCSASEQEERCENEEDISEIEPPDKKCDGYVYQPQKCAEVTVDVNDLTFAVNCSYCIGVYFDFSSFVNHVKTKHKSLLKIHTDNPLEVDSNEDSDSHNMSVLEPLTEFQDNYKAADIFEKEPSFTLVKASLEDIMQNSALASSCSSYCTDVQNESHKFGDRSSALNAESIQIQCDNKPLVTEVIKLMKEKPVIWSKAHPSHRNYKKRKAAIWELINSLSISFPHFPFTYKNVNTLINRLRLYYENDTKQIRDAREENRTYEPFLWCFNLLKFLGDLDDPLMCISPQMEEKNIAKENNNKGKKNGPTISKSVVKREVVHACENCGKQFNTVTKLKRHMPVHTNERPFVCFICGKGFRTYSSWFRHERTHNKNKPYKCTDCERSYSTAGMLRIHQKTHKNIRDKVCSICGKAFTQAKYLNLHKDIHLDEPKHKCGNCGKKFKQYSNMWVHRKRCIVPVREKVEADEAEDVSSVVQGTMD